MHAGEFGQHQVQEPPLLTCSPCTRGSLGKLSILVAEYDVFSMHAGEFGGKGENAI